MGKTAMKLLGLGDEEFYEGMGVYFVALATDLGYGLMLQSVGRRFRDFFVNLDNLHDYLKFTFQRMKAVGHALRKYHFLWSTDDLLRFRNIYRMEI